MKRFVPVLSIVFLATMKMASQDIVFPEKSLDTIYANDQKNVTLFFPDPIRQGITGSENFIFTYNREKEQHVGLLQALPGEESNLLVISNTGSIYSYILKYADTLVKLNYFISESGSIGNVNPRSIEKTWEKDRENSEAKPDKITSNKSSYSMDFSSYLIRSKQKIGNIKKENEGVILSVKNIVFNGGELFFVFELENNSPIDYELSFLSLAIETRKKGKKKSLQKIVQEPVLIYQKPEMIKKGSSATFIYVLPKFSIAEDKVVVIDLKEENGERDIKLKVNRRFINNPN